MYILDELSLPLVSTATVDFSCHDDEEEWLIITYDIKVLHSYEIFNSSKIAQPSKKTVVIFLNRDFQSLPTEIASREL